MTTKPILTVKDLSVTFPDNNGGLDALGTLSFERGRRGLIWLRGGCGGGKRRRRGGRAGLGENFMHHHQPKIGMVFQQSNLMPWRTVMENIQISLELDGAGSIKAQNKAREMIKLMGLKGFENSFPRDLSGGMAQRVAIALALIHDPDLLLLDEPFASLDALTRERMWTELSNIWQEKKKTVVMVTHSINESLFLADRVMVLTKRPGKIKLDVEVDLPRPRVDDIRYTSHFGKLAKKLRAAIE